MSKRSASDFQESSDSKKPKCLDNVEEIEEEIIAQSKNSEQLRKNLSEKESEAAFLRKMAADTKQRAEQADSGIVELKEAVAASDKQILKLKSTKNRMLNPVKLSNPLYDYLLLEVLQTCHSMRGERLIKFMMAGKEFLYSVIRFLKQRGCVTLTQKKISIGYCCDLELDFTESSQCILKLVLPIITLLEFEAERIDCQDFIFEQLGKNRQEQELSIYGLKTYIQINSVFTAALQKLHENGTRISFDDCVDHHLPKLPAIKIERLETDNLGRCLEAIDRSLCTVRHLSVDGKQGFRLYHLLRNQAVFPDVEVISFDWAIRKKFKPVFDALEKCFPNLKEVRIFCCKNFDYDGDSSDEDDEEVYGGNYDEVGDMESIWNKMKQDVEDASPQEIMMSIELRNMSEKYKGFVECLHGEKIDECTHRWTSQKNNLKTIELWHHRL
uniref:Uncharacterized protein n=1 Tax=Panagrolaimus sp. JU765 TaxID=591449 RepID=A0AC34QVR0_9BILA